MWIPYKKRGYSLNPTCFKISTALTSCYSEKFPTIRHVILSMANSCKDRKAGMNIPPMDDYFEKPLTGEMLNRILLD